MLTSQAVARAGDQLPLVSCIMPTADRRAFVPRSIALFLAQDYPRCELIILDDGADPVRDLVPPDPRLRYVRLERRVVLGTKRNLACDLARGEIIAHWDDDDWQAPHRLSYQAAALYAGGADICGAGRLLYYQPATREAWLYIYPQGLRRWLAGNTLCYRRAFWSRNPFPALAIGEDTRFVWSPRATALAATDDHRYCVGIVHSANTSPKQLGGAYWHPTPAAEVEALMGADLPLFGLPPDDKRVSASS